MRTVMTQIFQKEKGFTLVEVLVAVFIGLVIMAAVYLSMLSGQRSSAAIDSKVAAQQDVRAILETMAVEIGMASYNPNFVLGNFWINTACDVPANNQQYRGIQNATPTTITVEMDISHNGLIYNNANPAAKVGNENEIITYNYDMAGQFLTRNVNCDAVDQRFLGNDPDKPRSLRVVNDINQNGSFDAGDIPVFRYFDPQGIEIPAADLTNRIPEIRRIEITLAVDTEQFDPNTRERRRMIYSTGVVTRNHAIY